MCYREHGYMQCFPVVRDCKPTWSGSHSLQRREPRTMPRARCQSERGNAIVDSRKGTDQIKKSGLFQEIFRIFQTSPVSRGPLFGPWIRCDSYVVIIRIVARSSMVDSIGSKVQKNRVQPPVSCGDSPSVTWSHGMSMGICRYR